MGHRGTRSRLLNEYRDSQSRSDLATISHFVSEDIKELGCKIPHPFVEYGRNFARASWTVGENSVGSGSVDVGPAYFLINCSNFSLC